ncbi:MAG: 2-C-methyl-D-erythritol 4-phosphate cytidylyltransferase [Steroidobacteraceae bacterium]
MTANYWAVIPAAGVGKRMASDIPKQYLSLHGRSVLEWALMPFLSDARCRAVVAVIAADDAHWPRLSLQHPKLRVAQGGAERADSVMAGLDALLLEPVAQADDWVLVHDAARPCLHGDDLNALLAAATAHEAIGALLATPLADTLKQATADECVAHTVPRAGLWRALTPQMFRLDMLRAALQDALSRGMTVTDESAAIEAMGMQARLIAGRSDNLKITLPEDLLMAECVLAARR